MQEQAQSTAEASRQETASRPEWGGVDVINPVYRTKAINIAQQKLALVVFVFAESAAQ